MALLDKPPPRGLDEAPISRAVTDFPTVDDQAWRQRAEREIGDVDFSATLVHRTQDGLEIGPLYTAASVTPPDSPEVHPGPGGWRIAQRISHPSVEQAAEQIAAAQAHGASLIWLFFDDQQGIRIRGRSDLEHLLEGLEPQTEVVFEAGDNALVMAAMAASVRDAAEWRGWHFGCDPLARLATRGGLDGSVDSAFRQMTDLVAWGQQQAPEMRSVLVSTQPYHEAGCSTVQELAFALATGVEYLRRLCSAGLEIEAASRRVDFCFAVGRDLFSEIAKLRAARRLWAKAIGSWGGGDLGHQVRIHTHTSGRGMSHDAPGLNLLRGGAQAFAAGLGGAYSVMVAPHDAVSDDVSSDSRRLALNIQHMLAQETSLGRVSDPAAGSWYVEDLTTALARAAWEQFRDLERRGGMTQCLLDGHVIEIVTSSAQTLRQEAATRRQPIIGSSAFVELSQSTISTPTERDHDQPESPEDLSSEDLSSEDLSSEDLLSDSIFEPISESLEGTDLDLFELGPGPAALTVLELSVEAPGDLGELMELAIAAAATRAPAQAIVERLAGDGPAASCPPLVSLRLSEDFEALRQASDRWQAELGTRPRAALVDLGGSKDKSFLRRLLAVAGIEGIETDGPEAALQDSTWNIVVLCGNGARDPESVAEWAPRFRNQGTRWVLVDHAGGDGVPALESAGVDDFVYEGCDILALLWKLLDGLGAFG